MKVVLFFLFMVFVGNALANDYTLKGRVLAYGSNGEEVPLPDVELSVLYRKIKPSRTNVKGEFAFEFDKYRYKGKVTLSGRKIKLVVNEPGWVVATPHNGEFFLPKDLDNEPLIVRVVSNNSMMSVGSLNARFSAKNPIERDSTPKYVLQVFYTNDRGNAVAIKSDLESRNYTPFITNLFEDGQLFFKVFAGRFMNYHEAQRNKVLLMHYGYNDAFVRPLSK